MRSVPAPRVLHTAGSATRSLRVPALFPPLSRRRSKLIRQYTAETEPARKGLAPALPPCHPLVDLRRSHALAASAAAAACPASPHQTEPPTAALAAGAALLQTLRALCLRIEPTHPLGALAAATAQLMRLHRHPRCAALAPWATTGEESRAAAAAAVLQAASGLRPLVTMATALGKRSTAKRLSCLQGAAAEEAEEAEEADGAGEGAADDVSQPLRRGGPKGGRPKGGGPKGGAPERGGAKGSGGEEGGVEGSGHGSRGTGAGGKGGSAKAANDMDGAESVFAKGVGKKRATPPPTGDDDGSEPSAVRLRLCGTSARLVNEGCEGAEVGAAGAADAVGTVEAAEAAAAACAPLVAPPRAAGASGDPSEALADTLRELCSRRPAPAHALAPVALALGRIFGCHTHQEWAPARAPIRRATEAVSGLSATLHTLLGAPPPAAAAADTLAAAAAACTPNAYRAFLLFLREQRERRATAAGGDGCGAAGAPAAPASVTTSAAVGPKEAAAAAAAFCAQSDAQLAALGERACEAYRARLASLPNELAGLERRGTAEGGFGSSGSGSRGRRHATPCMVCREVGDKRDCRHCARCGGRMHLMCFFPPVVAADDDVAEEWTCQECRASAVPPLLMPKEGAELEAEVCEPADKGGAVVWKRAIVQKVLPRSRFSVMINPDEEDDFFEEYGIEEMNKEWRWPAAAVAANVATRDASEAECAAVAEERAHEKAALAADVTAADCAHSTLTEEFYREGVCVLEDGLTAEQVEACEDVVERGYRHYMHTVKTLDLQEKLSAVGFMEIKMRSAGRCEWPPQPRSLPVPCQPPECRGWPSVAFVSLR